MGLIQRGANQIQMVGEAKTLISSQRFSAFFFALSKTLPYLEIQNAFLSFGIEIFSEVTKRSYSSVFIIAYGHLLKWTVFGSSQNFAM